MNAVLTTTSPKERTSRAHFYAFLATLLLTVALFLRMAAPYLLSIFLGGLLALLAAPVDARLKRHLPPWAAAAATVFLVMTLVIGPIAAFGTVAARQGAEVAKKLSTLEEFSPRALTRTLSRGPVGRVLGSPDEVNARLKAAIRSAGTSSSGALLGLAAGIPLFLLQAAITLLTFYFFLLDGRRFCEWTLKRTAVEADVRDKLSRTFAQTARSTVMAGFAAAGTQSLVILVAYLGLNVPGAFVAAGGTFLLAWVPVLGSLPASLAGIAYLYSQDEMGRAGAMAAFAVLAGLSDNLVRPYVLKGRDDMHPLLGLVAIIGGVDMFGVLGLFLGPLLAAVLIFMLDLWPEIGARFGVDVCDGER
ncbi:MAG: AI-2E family transporter [Elusimicrobiota bacterium]|nr:MAG: AI-2E family transporter [Elusimicrobiota bacterium]